MPIKKAPEQMAWDDSDPITFPPSPAEFLPKIVGAWLSHNQRDPNRVSERETMGVRWKASAFGNPCDLSVRKELDGTPASNPPQIASLYRMNLGSAVHDNLQQYVLEAFPGATTEITIDLRPELDGMGRADFIIEEAIVPEENPVMWRTLLELKTIGGFGFKMAAAPFKGGPEGPKLGHLHQTAVMADKLDCDRMVIGYISMENISADLATKMGVDEVGKFSAEWHFDRNEIAILAQQARDRANQVLAEHATGIPTPPRVHDFNVPEGAVITEKGKWILEENGKRVDVGRTWACGYCDYRDVCDVPG